MRRCALLAVAIACLAQVPACTSSHGAPVRVVLTTLHPPRSPAAACDHCLTAQHGLRLKAGTVHPNAITVDATQRFQKIDGFGLAMTDSSAYLIDKIPNDRGRRDALMRKLFDVDRGIGISWVRVIIGASDFTPVKPPWYSYRPTPADPFDIGRARTGSPRGDYSNVIPRLRQAEVLSKGRITFFANPHSAPPWMKLNNSMSNFEPDSCILGYCRSAPTSEDLRGEYVDYFVDFIKAYAAKGVPIDAIGVQNEPNSPADYPSGDFAPADQADFVNRLKMGLAAQRPPLTQQVWAEATHPGDAPAIMVNAPNPAAIDGLSYHCYGLSGPSLRLALDAVTAFHEAYPKASIHETECTQDRNQFWPKAIDILIDHTRHWASSVAAWNLALDPHGGPHSTRCAVVRAGVCDDTGTGSIMTAPVVISGPEGAATARLTREYYELGHFTKFVRPGAVRVGSAEAGAVRNVAFENVDGSKVLVVHNGGRARTSFSVNVGGDRHFDVDDLSPDAIATYIW
jgi:glucosylceramidase